MVLFSRGFFVLALLALVPLVGAAWPHESSDLTPHPDARFGPLPNGLRYVVLPNAEPRDHVALRLVVLAGSLHEQDDQRGFAHFVEHMAFASTRRFPRHTIVDTLQRHGIAFGADATAFTFPTHTVYQIDASLDAARERLDEAFSALREFASEQTFDPAALERERGVIESERRARDHWQARVSLARENFIHPSHLRTRRNPIGDESAIAAADAAALRAFYETWYRPDNALLLAIGDLSADTLEECIRSHFSSWSAPAAPLPPPPDRGSSANPDQLTSFVYAEPAAGALSLELVSILPGPQGVETAAARTAAMRREIVITMLHERLQQLRRQHARDFGTAGAFTREDGQHHSEFILAIDSATSAWSDAAAALAREWRRAYELGFSAEEIAAASRTIRRRFEHAASSSEASPDLGDRFAFALVADQIPSSWSQLGETMEAALATFTPDSSRDVFREMWPSNASFLFGLGNLPLADPASALVDSYRAGLATELLALPHPPPAELRYTPAASAGPIRRRTHVADLDLHLIEFANGVRLNLKCSDSTRNSVALRARVGSGRLGQPEDLPGLALLARAYINDAGVGRHPGHELQRFVDERNFALSFSDDEDAFVFSGGAATASLPDLLQLLSAYLSDPAWRFEEFEAAQRRVISHFHDSRHEPSSSLQIAAARVISRDDPRFILPAPADTNARTLTELMNWLDPELRSGGVEIGLVGDFDLDTTLDFAARTLGALPPRAARAVERHARPAVRFERKPGRWQSSVETNIPRAALRAQWPVRGCGDIHQRRRLETLAAIFQNRVRREIREQLGATYDPSAEIFSGDTLRDDGYLLIEFSLSPADTPRLAQRIVDIAADLAAHGVSEEELQAVVQPRLAENAARLRDNGYWLFNVLSAAQTQPARLDWPRTRGDDYARITRRQIARTAASFLSPARAQVFVAAPSSPDRARALAVQSPTPAPRGGSH